MCVVLQQHPNDGDVPLVHCHVKWGLLSLVSGVEVSSAVCQQLDDLGLIAEAGVMHGTITVLVLVSVCECVCVCVCVCECVCM